MKLRPLLPGSPGTSAAARATLLAGILASTGQAQGNGFDPPVAPDLDPDPDRVEVRLVAQESDWEFLPGVPTRTFNYNGSIPGPTIVGKVGDIVVVHFENRLPEPTTVHWHGIEGYADMDGSHISQRWVEPGASFTYEMPLLNGGLHWYHPHVRTFDQVEKGLYGAILVREPAEAALGLDRLQEHILVFDDVLLDANNQIVPGFSFTDPLQKTLYLLNGREGNLLLLNGKAAGTRELEVRNGRLHRWRVLNAANSTFCRLDLNVDGEVPMAMIGSDTGIIPQPILRQPVIPLGPVQPNLVQEPTPLANPVTPSILPGEPAEVELERWWEAAASEDHSVPQNDLQGIFLVPGERLDVVFLPLAEEGDVLRVFQFDWFRGRHSAEYNTLGQIVLGDLVTDGRAPPKFYMNLRVVGERRGPPPTLPTSLRPAVPIDPATAEGELPVHFGHTLPDPQGNLTMFAQAAFAPGPTGMTMTPLPTSAVDSFVASDVDVGETWIWEIVNLSHGDHPFHTHGFSFQPYELQYVDSEIAQYNYTRRIPFNFRKDTLRVPPRLGNRGKSKAIVRALVTFDDTGREGRVEAEGGEVTFDRDGNWVSGGWLFHCHVLEHASRGMLSFYEVHDPADAYRLLGKHLAGHAGPPHLTGFGQPVAGAPIRLDVVGAAPGARVGLVLGRTAARAARFGGELVPALEAVRWGQADGAGRVTFELPGWEVLPSGSSFYAQAGFLDGGAPRGVALSNALSCRVP